MTIKPNWNRVFVKLDDATKTGGGLYVPQTADQRGLKTGVVIAVSDGYQMGDTWIALDPVFPVGTRVVVDDCGATKVPMAGDDVVCVRNEDIVGTVVE